ncbi:type II secretion system protein GspL [Sphingomonas naphthae]|uniref:Type II secretion system protein GspL n=1 Tax=Sphingomonas naphthae TaxID=1813468 RepID=A0ABY7TI43_9SPHN|nr:type II secretion system protein GspL [Sphingomonas naphthae]WCT72877.1 type II secretion system protein GspL [Sphingomonas naphthae]
MNPSTATKGWRLTAAGLLPVEDMTVSGGGIVTVPTEQALLLTADLPLPTRAKRVAALPFAIEDRIAESIEAVHLALGQEIAPQRYLAAVVRHDVMRGWVRLLAEQGLDTAPIVPDALLLPRAEAGWVVRIAEGRALVRGADGAGFALPAALLAGAWIAAGRPAVLSLGDPLPAGIESEAELAVDWPIAPPVDLRQGAYVARRRPIGSVGRRVMIVAAAGVLAHAAIAAADTVALRTLAAKREGEMRALVATAMPSVSPGDDVAAAALAALPVGNGPSGPPDRLMPLLARVSSAAAPAGPLALEGMTYDAATGRLTLAVKPGGEAALASALTSSGLSATAGAGQVLVRETAR